MICKECDVSFFDQMASVSCALPSSGEFFKDSKVSKTESRLGSKSFLIGLSLMMIKA